MKNIHVLPTDKPSRLSFDFDDNKYLLTDDLVLFDNQNLIENRNIYITSDEDIKISDYILCNNEVYKWHDNIEESDRKIILTTDQDLIKDGVQAIPDDFLEWFVENPSCERVEVIKDEIKVKSNGIQELMKDEYYRQFPEELPNCVFIDKYKIIIPKEKDYFPDIKIGSILSSEDIVKDITELENQSFEGWTTDSIKGYLLACKNIKEKLI